MYIKMLLMNSLVGMFYSASDGDGQCAYFSSHRDSVFSSLSSYHERLVNISLPHGLTRREPREPSNSRTNECRNDWK